jgi:acyl-CoA thioester hydrolase
VNELQPGHVFRTTARIYYEDTDLSGVVYHANYLRYFERGRSESLREIGFDHARLLALPQPCAFAVTDMTIAFRRAARIDDLLDVRTLWAGFGGVRMTILQNIRCGDTLIATATVEACTLTLDARPRRPPPELVAAIRPVIAPSPQALTDF